MPTRQAPEQLRTMAQACLGAITGPDGATESQLTILHAIACNFWGLDPADLTPESALTAEQAAAGITDELPRRRTREMLVMLELCRHPLESSHEQRIAEYCFALGGDGPGIALARELVANGAEAALGDYMRRFMENAAEMMEPAMLEIAAADEAEAARRLAEIDAAVRAAAPGTLGAEFVAFYERNGFTIDASSVHLFGHDMTHVIGGYDATPVGEVCIGAMKLMITDSDIHWIELLGSLLIHEAGMLPEGYKVHQSALTDPANVREAIRAMERGRETQKDFSNVDHLSMIDWPYADVQEAFGIPPL